MSKSALREALRGDIPLRVVIAVYVGIVAAYLVPLEFEIHGYVPWTYFRHLLLILAIVSAQYGLRRFENRTGQTFWNYFSFALLLSVAGALVETALVGEHGLSLLVDCIHASYYLTLVFATEVRPDLGPVMSGRGREQELHRGGSVSFILALLIYCSVIPSQLNPEEYLAGRFSILLYLCLDFFFLARFAYLSGVARSVRWRLVYRCLFAFFACSVVLLIAQYQAAVGQRPLPPYLSTKWGLLWHYLAIVPLFLATRWSRYAGRGETDEENRELDTPHVWEPIAFYAIAFPLLHLFLDSYGQLSMASRAVQQGLVIIYFAFFGFLALVHSTFRENKRQMAESALRESETRYRQLIESHPDAILIEQQGKLSYINTTGIEKFGNALSQEDRSFSSLGLPPPPPPEERQQTAIPVECHVVTAQDDEMDLEVSYIDISYMGQPACQAIARDVTEVKRQRAQSERLARLASLGQFSAAMAHEIRNPLAAIVMHGFFLAKRLPKEDENQRALADINVAVDRMRKLVDGILGFVRPAELQLVEEDLVAIIGSAQLDLQRQANLAEISIIEDYQHHDATATVDVHQLVTVFSNILDNAVRAMPDGGSLTLRTNPAEDRIEVTVEDTGEGITKDDLERIFEPFFTRRDGGVGLGLALVARILDQHDCRYRVESEPGQGTRFILNFALAARHRSALH